MDYIIKMENLLRDLMKKDLYKMEAGVYFPMIMKYKDNKNPFFKPYFYFLNSHNDVVYYSNSNFDDFETYEYNYWGVNKEKNFCCK